MPSKTPRQARTMAAAAHDPDFAKRMGIPQSVAKEFNQEDKGMEMLNRSVKRSELLKLAAKKKRKTAGRAKRGG